jgi:hypothetical protein
MTMTENREMPVVQALLCNSSYRYSDAINIEHVAASSESSVILDTDVRRPAENTLDLNVSSEVQHLSGVNYYYMAQMSSFAGRGFRKSYSVQIVESG